MNGVMEMNAHTISLTQRNSQAHAHALTHKRPNGPSQHHLENKSDDPRKRKKESRMIYGVVGWFLTASAGMSNGILVGCYREEKKVTVGRQWVSVLVACSASGSGRQAGRQHAVQSWLSWCMDLRGGE